MKKQKLLAVLGIALLAVFAFTSCEKDDGVELTGTEMVEDDATVSALFEDIEQVVDSGLAMVDISPDKAVSLKNTTPGTCPLVTFEVTQGTFWPVTITIDYGEGCEGFYGQTRKGKIIISLTNGYRVPGSVKTITLENYYINDILVEGTKTITNMGRNGNDNLYFQIELAGGKVTFPDGTVIERSSVREREWIAGEETWTIWDDEYLISGSATGTNFQGETYTHTITSDLHVAASCRFILSGVVLIDRTDMDVPFELDYGDGTCDNKAVIRRGEAEKEIELRYRHRWVK